MAWRSITATEAVAHYTNLHLLTEKGMATHSSILAWKIHGQRSLVGYSPWGGKELDMTGQLSTHLLSFLSGREAIGIMKMLP